MKLLFFLLSFLMIYLPCMPCGDSRECNVKAELKISKAANHDHGNHDTEACTPFCSCACCATSVNFQQATYVKVPALLYQSVTFRYNDDFCSYSSHSIWQPPRLG